MSRQQHRPTFRDPEHQGRPLLQAQKGVWAAQRLDPASPRYNCGGYLDLHGPLNITVLTQALRQAMSEAEVLRSRFREVDGNPTQITSSPEDHELETVSLERHPDAQAQALTLMKQDLMVPQDLLTGQLVRHVLYRLDDAHHLLYVRYHHILMDGFGQIVFWRRLADLYNERLGHGNAHAAALPVNQLSILLDEEASYLASARYEADLKHWCEKLADAPDPTRLGLDQTRHARGLLRQMVQLPTEQIERLHELASEMNTRWSVLCLAAVAAFLARLGREEEVVLGLPVSARLSAVARATPAMMANELPLRLSVPADATLYSLVGEVDRQLRGVLGHQRTRGEVIGRALQRTPQERPLTSVVANVISFDQPIVLHGLGCEAHHLSTGPVDDLLIGFYGAADAAGLQIYFDANPARYDPQTLSRHRQCFVNFLGHLVAQASSAPLAAVPTVSPQDISRIAAFNDTARPYDLEAPLHQLVDEQAQRSPNAVAVSCEHRTLSFLELKSLTDTLAARLASQGVAAGSLIGVCCERGVNMVVSLLAVLKAGGAYVPLDPELPERRLAFQIEDAGIRLILTSSPFSPVLSALQVDVLEVDRWLATGPLRKEAPRSGVTLDHPAYVLFTSGTTGQPKAVAVPHRGVVNRLLWMQEAYSLDATDCVLQKTPFTFDVSVWEFFWPMIVGARLHLARPGGQRDPRYLHQVMRDEAVTTAHFVPPMLDLFLDEPGELPSLRRIVCSGEALKQDTVRRFFERFDPVAPNAVALHNLYGPTEASIDVTHWTCGPEDANAPVPIGHPVANTQIHLLDKHGQPVPAGWPGELHIGGVQVALGYVNRPELTRERFVPNPFGPGLLYRTGDLARHRPDGAIEFLGRLDHQVKVRGLRIELGEIEAVLLSHEAVRQAAVIAQERSKAPPALLAYITTTAEDQAKEPSGLTDTLLTLLRDTLPDYMVPARIMVLPALPLSSNGKLDRKALPLPTLQAEGEPQNSPPQAGEATSLQALMQRLWADVLALPHVGLDDGFFALGGDSMTSIRLRAATERHGHTFALQDIYKFGTVRQLASRLTPHVATRPHTAPFSLISERDRERLPGDVVDAYPLSAMQVGMLSYADMTEEDSGAYRVVTSLRLGCALDEAALRRALADTFNRHPSLRCSYDLTAYSEPLQRVHASVTVPLEVRDDWRHEPDLAKVDAGLRAWAHTLKLRRFDVGQAPLLAFIAHPLANGCFQLTVVEHHVVLDGWSDIAMLDEITRRYKVLLTGQDLWLPAVGSSYAAYVALERRTVSRPETRQFWLDHLQGASPSPLPAPRAGQQAAEPAQRHRAFHVPTTSALSQRLRAIARVHALPLKTLLVAAHVTVLRAVCGEAEVLTGLIANGRLEEEGAEDVIGVFLNTLPLRVDSKAQSFIDVARHVFAFEQVAAPHRRYPYVQMQRDQGGHLQLDSYVNFMDFHVDWQSSPSSIVQDSFGVAETNFSLAVNFLVDPASQTIGLWLDCDMKQLAPDFCERLGGYYLRALQAMVDAPSTQIDQVDLLGAPERHTLALWTETLTAFDREATVHGLIEAQARRTPDAVALVHRHSTLSYRALDERANQLARQLAQEGVRRGDLVGIALHRGLDMVTALLAVMKAGAAYVPLDPDYPGERLNYIVEDAGIQCIVTDDRCPIGLSAGRMVLIDDHAAQIAGQSTLAPGVAVDAEDAAYVIYTSGSTGRPKGTRIRHRNAVNFFAGMGERIGCRQDDVILALTSISFDISVLELLWPLTTGAKVVVAGEQLIGNLSAQEEGARGTASGSAAQLGLSLFFFAAATGDAQRAQGYRLVRQAARYADEHGFEAVWTPERHFHSFGGLYPNPSVMAASLASITSQVALRCGSVVAPLHDVVRLTEEWSLVDNLSEGRVGLAFASGWNANDFALQPERYADRKGWMLRQLQEFRHLWSGGSVMRRTGNGEEVPLRVFPSPIQKEAPVWLTSAGAVETFRQAGALGVNVLTHLLGQDIDTLAEKLRVYRQARAEHGHEGPGHVTLMIHTFLLEDAEQAKAIARGPFRDYLRTSTDLWRQLSASMGVNLDGPVSDDDLASVLDAAVERYFERSGLFGSPRSVAGMARALSAVGVDELACLIDFGIDTDDVLRSLPFIKQLKDLHQFAVDEVPHSLAALCIRHQATLIQATPSFYAAVTSDAQAMRALKGIRKLLIGGEAFPSGLADRLATGLPDTRIFNMYGPTETTVWSTVHELDRHRDLLDSVVPIGRPIANTDILILDDAGRRTPIGVSGELWIGGEGVSGLYLGQPGLTAERFPLHPDGDGHGQIYRTGDRARWRADGVLEFLGRVDRQVKILGHRIEPDEVEGVLSRHPQVEAAAVVVRQRPDGQPELVAYIAPNLSTMDRAFGAQHVARWGDVWDGAYKGNAQLMAGAEEARFEGWLSSYTGEPIAHEEMSDWLTHTIARIQALKPHRLLDVGVGVGLILRAFADKVQAYTGLDVATSALDAARAALAARGLDSRHVTLHHGDALAMAQLPDGSADTVVINSVIQYFPSVSYLEQALCEAWRVTGKAGRLFIGDVRDIALLEVFHTSVQLHRANPLDKAGAIKAEVARQIAQERELCLTSQYFEQLSARLLDDARVRIEIKPGEAANELNCFRFDVTIGAPAAQAGATALPWSQWQDTDSAVQEIRLRLADARPGATLTVSDIHDQRLDRPLALWHALQQAGDDDTAWDVERAAWEMQGALSLHPRALVELAGACGWEVRLLKAVSGRIGAFDAHFERVTAPVTGSAAPAHQPDQTPRATHSN